MRKLLLSTGILCAVTTGASAAPISVSVKIDQWQSPYHFRTVRQTRSNSNFTAGDEYAGFFSGLVTVGSTSTRYVFFCTEINQNINLNKTYSDFKMYAPDEYTQTPFHTGRPAGGGVTLDPGQERFIQGIFGSLGINAISGFTSSTAQDLPGFPLTAANQAAMDALTNDQAALAQISVWEMTHELYDPLHPADSINLHSGQIRWAWGGNVAFDKTVETQFNATVAQGLAAVPEPGVLALVAATTSILGVRPARRYRRP